MAATNGKSYPNLIGGDWKTLDGDALENHNPADYNEIVGLFPMATLGDARNAIDSARSALPSWVKTPAPARGAILDKASQIISARLDEIATALTREEGKTFAEAKGEVIRARDIFKYYSGEGWRYGGQVLPSSVNDELLYTRREPLGVVSIITPWNFPIAIPAWKIAPALNDIAVLVRLNAQTPYLEQQLITRGLPYRVSQPFYARAEISTLINYSRLAWGERHIGSSQRFTPSQLAQFNDAWSDVCNRPKRYITRELREQIARAVPTLQQPLNAILQQAASSAERDSLVDDLEERAELIAWLSTQLDRPAQEERRLFYVAVTRTKCQLMICAIKSAEPSQFLQEAAHTSTLAAARTIEQLLARGPRTWQVDDAAAFMRHVAEFHLERYFQVWWAASREQQFAVAHTLQRLYAAAQHQHAMTPLKLQADQLAVWRSIAPLTRRRTATRLPSPLCTSGSYCSSITNVTSRVTRKPFSPLRPCSTTGEAMG